MENSGLQSVSAPDHSVCEICGQDHPFELPPRVLKAALSRKLVLFAGAGISTESRRVFPDTFAEVIADRLETNAASLTFPHLMSAFEETFGRAELLLETRRRLDYMKGFPELLTIATRFHQELSTAFFLDQIVTTNWDTFFEEYTDATPIVIPSDYAFWEVGGRRVFKLHGSMSNLSTIIATQEDYDRCYRRLRSGIIGGTLKHLLATKSVVFIGYSFGDSDLNRILSFMKRELGDVLPRSFVVSPHGYGGDDFPQGRVIATDGAFFIKKLKDAAIDLQLMRPDSIYDEIARLSTRVRRANARVNRHYRAKATPAVIHTLAYQDGLRHAFDRIEALRASGFYSDPHSTHVSPRSYEAMRR
jgi:hypothetical protein